MKNRILSIMDVKRKKSGLALICIAVILMAGIGIVYSDNNMLNIHENNTGHDGATVRLRNDDIISQDCCTSIEYVEPRPELEFYIEGKDIAQIEIKCENEFLYAVDWTETQHEKYWNAGYSQVFDEERQEFVFNPDLLYGKSMVFEFNEGFSDYDKIWYRWTPWNLYKWASEDNFSHIIGGCIQAAEDMTEEEKLALAAADDMSGVAGLGHIQLEGYPEELRKDCITVTIIDREGNSTEKHIYVAISNNELNQTVVSANIK